MKNKYGSTDNLNKFSILMKGLQNTHSSCLKDLETKSWPQKKFYRQSQNTLLALSPRLRPLDYTKRCKRL